MTITGIKCPKCKDEIYSMSRHDLVHCKCKLVYVDGGRSYVRLGMDMKQTKYELGDIEYVEKEIND